MNILWRMIMSNAVKFSLINQISNSSSNGGGNPYHDEEGKFTNAPTAAFKKIGYEPTGKDEMYVLEPHPLQVGYKNREGKNFTTVLDDKQLRALGTYQEGFDQIAKCFKNEGNLSNDREKLMARDIKERARTMSEVFGTLIRASESKMRFRKAMDKFESFEFTGPTACNPQAFKNSKRLAEAGLKSADTNPMKNFYEKAALSYSLLTSGFKTMDYIDQNIGEKARTFSESEMKKYVDKYGE